MASPDWYDFRALNSSGQHELFGRLPAAKPAAHDLHLHATLHYDDLYIALVWLGPEKNRPVISGCVRVRNEDCLEWIISRGRKEQTSTSHTSESDIRSKLKELAELHPVTSRNFEAIAVTWPMSGYKPESHPCPPLPPQQSPWDWLGGQIRRMVREVQKDGGYDF